MVYSVCAAHRTWLLALTITYNNIFWKALDRRASLRSPSRRGEIIAFERIISFEDSELA